MIVISRKRSFIVYDVHYALCSNNNIHKEREWEMKKEKNVCIKQQTNKYELKLLLGLNYTLCTYLTNKTNSIFLAFKLIKGNENIIMKVKSVCGILQMANGNDVENKKVQGKWKF